jgi:hypothetical protein
VRGEDPGSFCADGLCYKVVSISTDGHPELSPLPESISVVLSGKVLGIKKSAWAVLFKKVSKSFGGRSLHMTVTEALFDSKGSDHWMLTAPLFFSSAEFDAARTKSHPAVRCETMKSGFRCIEEHSRLD